QLLLAIALAATIMARWGATGGFVSIALCALAGAVAALIGPSRLADLDPGESIAGAPPLPGWIALRGPPIYRSGPGAVGVYLEPLARQAGLDPGVARTALWVSLAAQVVGSAAATAMAGRIRWFVVFLITTTAYLAAWWMMGLHAPAWLFIAANAAAGVF